MPALPVFLLRHTITIERYHGSGPFGDVFGPPVAVRCFLDEQRRLVRDQTGEDVVSEATAYAPLGTTLPVGSRVQLPGGRVATVITARPRDGGGLPVPDHLEITLT